MRILVVEDDEGIACGVLGAMRRENWAADVAPSVAAAWSALSSEPFDIVLLDLSLPDGSGADVLQRVRQAPPDTLPAPTMPVLVMAARDDMSVRIAMLDMGADDYMTKPCNAGELAARVRALHRRATGHAQPLLRWGDFQVDPAARRVHRADADIELSAREFGVLIALLEASPRVLSRQQIETSLCSWSHPLESNAIEVHVHHLRKKLGGHVIRTLRGVGYFVPRDAA